MVEQHPDVVESLVFGQEHDNDVRIVLLVRLMNDKVLDETLIADLKQRIRTTCTPRHVPALVVQVDDLPRTRSNKLVELALADAVNAEATNGLLAEVDAAGAVVDGGLEGGQAAGGTDKIHGTCGVDAGRRPAKARP